MKQTSVLILAWLVIGMLSLLVYFYMLLMIVCNQKRAVSMTLAYDRLGNAAMGQGDRETISSWSGRKDGWQERFINWLFFHLTGEVNHCDNNREMV